jgi:hypothetical protein
MQALLNRKVRPLEVFDTINEGPELIMHNFRIQGEKDKPPARAS